jgi:large subunit ribosomal protein L11
MAKKVTAQVKLQIPAEGHSARWEPLGPGRQYHGFLQGVQRQDVNQDQEGLIIPVVITIFSDRVHFHAKRRRWC